MLYISFHLLFEWFLIIYFLKMQEWSPFSLDLVAKTDFREKQTREKQTNLREHGDTKRLALICFWRPGKNRDHCSVKVFVFPSRHLSSPHLVSFRCPGHHRHSFLFLWFSSHSFASNQPHKHCRRKIMEIVNQWRVNTRIEAKIYLKMKKYLCRKKKAMTHVLFT